MGQTHQRARVIGCYGACFIHTLWSRALWKADAQVAQLASTGLSRIVTRNSSACWLIFGRLEKKHRFYCTYFLRGAAAHIKNIYTERERERESWKTIFDSKSFCFGDIPVI